MSIKIPLGKGIFATVDDEDSLAVCYAGKWNYNKLNGYAEMQKYLGVRNKKIISKVISLHRFIAERMGLCLKQQIDHINNDKLDCRRCNLRVASHTQNCVNSIHPIGASGYRGVQIRGNRFVMKYSKDSKTRYGGIFKTAIEAAKAYDKIMREMHGEYAKVNFND